METIGRNEPCHCGSGRKYKRCCLEKDQANSRLQSALLTSGQRSVPLKEKDIVHMIDAELNWSTDSYRALAFHLVEHMKGRYEDNVVVEAVALWHRFAEDAKPSFRKPGIYAAAIEYAVSEANEIARSQAELADVYEVSATSLSKRLVEVNAYIETKLSGSKPAKPAAAEAIEAPAKEVPSSSFDPNRELERLSRAMRALAMNQR